MKADIANLRTRLNVEHTQRFEDCLFKIGIEEYTKCASNKVALGHFADMGNQKYMTKKYH